MRRQGFCFGISYTDKDIEKISEGIETVVDIAQTAENASTTEIPEAYIEDEQNLEEQEVEDEGFELQGEIAYNGSSEYPNVQLGEYAGLTYYSQIDSRWKNLPYTSTGNKSQTIGSSACGPTCAAMVVSSIKGTITPPQMADLYVEYGFRSANNGTYWSAFRWTADVFDIGYKELYKLDEVCDLLEQNYMVIAACGNGLFTTGGHFILIYDYEDTNGSGQCDKGDRLKIYDPYLYSGKFNTSTRRGKATVSGNTVYVEKETFRAYANYSGFFAFKNDRTDTTENNNSNVTTSTYTRYVKTNTGIGVNVRRGPGTSYSKVSALADGTKVTVYSESGNWSEIGTNKWVCSDYLTNSNVATTSTSYSTKVGSIYKLKSRTILYASSKMSGTYYTYLANTRIEVLSHASSTVDYIYIPATGRYAYCYTSAFTSASNSNSTTNLTGKYRTFKSNTIIYSKSNLSGTKYYYLPNTYVKILEDLGNIDKVYVTATGRVGYVSENVYK